MASEKIKVKHNLPFFSVLILAWPVDSVKKDEAAEELDPGQFLSRL